MKQGQNTVYKLNITERADELLDNILYYLVYCLKSEQAASHLLNEIDRIYERLEENPRQFPVSRDIYLSDKGYREAIISEMNYVIIFDIQSDIVSILGIFHQLEKYQIKL